MLHVADDEGEREEESRKLFKRRFIPSFVWERSVGGKRRLFLPDSLRLCSLNFVPMNLQRSESKKMKMTNFRPREKGKKRQQR